MFGSRLQRAIDYIDEVPYELDGFRMFSFSDVCDDGTSYSEIWVPVRRKG